MDRVTMSVHDMAQRMGISLPKAYELTRSAGFPVVRVGTRVLIPITDFQKWLSSRAYGEYQNKQGV